MQGHIYNRFNNPGYLENQKPFSKKEITTIHGIKEGRRWLQDSKQTAAFSETACSIQTQRIIRSMYFQSSYCHSHGNCGKGIWSDDQTVNVRVKYQVQNYSGSSFSCNIYLTAEFCSVWFLFFCSLRGSKRGEDSDVEVIRILPGVIWKQQGSHKRATQRQWNLGQIWFWLKLDGVVYITNLVS